MRALPLATCALLVAACQPHAGPAAPAASPVPAAARLPEVQELDVAAARQGLAEGRYTSVALAQAYLDRIAAIDDDGPRLNAVIELNPRALEEARNLDIERRKGRIRGPLHGIPVLLKDNIDAVGMANSAGSLALSGHRPAQDAFLVSRLREAGMVVLGKTNLSEWANFRSTRSTSGWSSRGGQTRNPYVLDRNPCGSSSGTGSAIAASLATVGVGTETNGSILCPAAVNGLVGLKPTVGLVSRSGIIPISASQDTAGPMARSVADAAALLQAMAAPDPADPAAREPGHERKDYLAALSKTALSGKRIGVLRQSMGFHPDVDAAVERAIVAIRAAGAEVVDARIPTYGEWNAPQLTVLLYEFKAGLDLYLAQSGAPVGSLQALVEWNRRQASEAMPHFGQELFEQALAKGSLEDREYRKARDDARRLAGRDGLLHTLDALTLDAIIAPAMSPAWLTDPVNGDHFTGAGYGAAAVAGTPSLTVPMGDSRGLPLGLAWMGRPYAEAELLGMAYAFEQATAARKPPAFIPTLEP